MSLIFRTYGCDACQRSWEVLVDRQEPPPCFCQYCGISFTDDIAPIPSKVAIGGSPIVKGVDGTYRWVEESSAARAEENDAPHMKITNMRDHLREGDIAAMPLPVNTVTQHIEEVSRMFGGRYGFQGPAAGSGEARPTIATESGKFVGPGHIAISAVQGNLGQTHAAARLAIEATGKLVKPKE